MLFDSKRYIIRYFSNEANFPSSYDNCLEHYRLVGHKSGFEPHAIFDTNWYRERCDEAGIIIDNEIDCLSHFIEVGQFRKISPHPLFDITWYLDQNISAREAFESGIDPITHFIDLGYKEGFWPHYMFNTKWFVETNFSYTEMNSIFEIDPLSFFIDYKLDNNVSTHPLFDSLWYKKNYMRSDDHSSPILHYIKTGISSNNNPCRFGIFNAISKTVDIRVADIRLGDTPLVSIIVINLNGCHHLIDLAKSIRNQTYTNFELIFVDNGSTDNSVELIKELMPNVRVIRLQSNIGFAAANNIGYDNSRGELIALLNNDTKVDSEWLGNLVHKLQSKSEIAAATSKVRFWSKFCKIEMESISPFAISKKELLTNLNYKKVICRLANDNDTTYEAIFINGRFKIELLVPASEKLWILFIQEEYEPYIKITSKNKSLVVSGIEKHKEVQYYLTESDIKYSKFVINNAGSYEPDWLETADRGFGEFDNGQYDYDTNVDLICGCAVLLRREALQNQKIFIEQFYAYFEDSDLSKRLSKSGYDLIYCSNAVVYHKHSATSVEKSDTWFRLVEKNKTVYKYLHENKKNKNLIFYEKLSDLNHQIKYFSDVENNVSESDYRKVPLLKKIYEDIKSVESSVKSGHWVPPVFRKVGIFNNYWNTLGGGEAHALEFAKKLKSAYAVELISEIDFDLEYVAKYYGVSPDNLRKRIISQLKPALTHEYFIFLNSSYMNECVSLAEHSFYIVSFPSRNPSKDFISSYKFFPNSQYTLGWMKHYWGNDMDYELIYPTISSSFFEIGENRESFAPGKKFILSVGRFFDKGHSKNQLDIAEIFNEIVNEYADLSDWKLLLAGSINDYDYYERVRSISNENIDLYPNCSVDELRGLYAKSVIYIHASGLGRNLQEEPENFEHFGMTIAEAAAAGLYPIVYNAAGPAEIVASLGFGDTYNSREQMKSKLIDRMKNLFSNGSDARISLSINKASKMYYRSIDRSNSINNIIPKT